MVLALGLALLGTLPAASYRGAMSGVDGAAHEAFTGSVHLIGVVAATLFALLAVATSRITLDA